MKDTLVIGSGLSGMASTLALVERGVSTTVVDGGARLEPDRRDVAQRLGRTPPETWPLDEVRRLTDNPTIRQRIPEKRVHGSDFWCHAHQELLPTERTNTKVVSSLARGGMSTVWGATLMPTAAEDMRGWPFGVEELAPHYRAVLNAIPVVATQDGMDTHFPLHTTFEPHPDGSATQQSMLDRVTRHGAALAEAGVWVGGSRLAIRVATGSQESGCNACGLCLSGCPRHAIFEATDVIDQLATQGDITYRAGFIVTHLDELSEGVRVTGMDVGTGREETEVYQRVFLAAGPVQSARLLLASGNRSDQTYEMKTAQKFLMPFLGADRDAQPYTRPRVALPELFIEILDPAVSPHWVHLQVSTSGPMVWQRLGLQPHGEIGLRHRLFRPLVERLHVGWGGLNSAHSASLKIRLEGGTLSIRGHENPDTRARVRAVFSKLKGTREMTGLRPLELGLKVSSPGEGGHYGSFLPMSVGSHANGSSDLLGRPPGLQRVHVTDASVLPAIPGTTLGLTTMANAHRIALGAP